MDRVHPREEGTDATYFTYFGMTLRKENLSISESKHFQTLLSQ